MTPYFAIDKLENVHGNFKLGPVSMELDKGEYMVVLGPTGCGKTSLLRNIAGIAVSKTGDIYLDGENINNLPPHKRKIGYVTQTSDLFPHLTVKQNVGFGLKYQKLSYADKKAKTGRFLELFGLTAIADQHASTLSGGETKRAAMARSLITEPRILLLDEPLGMLDHNGRKKMTRILQMIHTELKTTTIHVTHDRHEAWSIARKCAVMNDGMVMQTGSTSELFRMPQSRFVAEFLGGTNIFEAEFKDNIARISWLELKIKQNNLKNNGWILIRPEKINIVDATSKSKFNGTISEIKDSGEFIEIVAESVKSVSIMVHTSLDNAIGLKTGDKICLDWDDESVHTILKD